MLILILCILLNSLIGVFFKLFEKYSIDNFQAIVVNYLVCVLTAAIVYGGNPIPNDIYDRSWFWFASGLGVFFILVFNLFALTVQKTGIMAATIFQKMSLVAPSIIAIVFYHESSGILKWLGIVVSVVAIVLISYGENKGDSKLPSVSDKKNWIYPLATFMGSCVIDSSIFLVEKHKLVTNGDIQFLASLFLFAGITGALILIYRILKAQTRLKFKNIVAGICLGIPNFFSIYLLLLALQQGWDGSLVFPVNNVGVLVLAAVSGIIFFKEKLSLIKMVGFILSLFAIFFISYSSW